MALKQAYDYMKDNSILELDKYEFEINAINISFDLEDIINEVEIDLKEEGDVTTRIYFDEEHGIIPVDYFLFADIDLLKKEGKTDEEINCSQFFVDTKLSHVLNIFKLVNIIV